MADIELVIKIPEESYQTILNHAEEILDESSFIEPKYLYRAVIDGIPLPKEHGRLIDADALEEELHRYTEAPYLYALKVFNDAPTIIEADMAESEDKE